MAMSKTCLEKSYKTLNLYIFCIQRLYKSRFHMIMNVQGMYIKSLLITLWYMRCAVTPACLHTCLKLQTHPTKKPTQNWNPPALKFLNLPPPSPGIFCPLLPQVLQLFNPLTGDNKHENKQSVTGFEIRPSSAQVYLDSQ